MIRLHKGMQTDCYYTMPLVSALKKKCEVENSYKNKQYISEFDVLLHTTTNLKHSQIGPKIPLKLTHMHTHTRTSTLFVLSLSLIANLSLTIFLNCTTQCIECCLLHIWPCSACQELNNELQSSTSPHVILS